ncbi:zinc finger A20 and AN1 domain-containing stress-associated protein 5-like [Senna tora]|uniref:Zinc finger A20 and AN1 domain-containing stress-associated protein 5-like n=1 Tax=Senna tora TaxID=362788 RepID=A0A834X0U3_9FABA|nr:zinc finger A20 and AN1 domain-containing stress-associated protein 5-like [Senna tora]
MVQKTEKEETEFKVPETITPCVNNCGVTASTAISTPSKFSDDKTSRSTASRSPKRSYPLDRTKSDEATPSEAKRVVNRCSGCRRKVGLTGFRCRCGELFCSQHRYSDRHDCSYDYKTAGREAIARENPVIKAAKIVKV